MWLKVDGFADKVRHWWSSYHQFHDSRNFIMAQKRKALKKDIKRWNEHKFGNVIALNKERIAELSVLDSL
jgi:hypothetical protein